MAVFGEVAESVSADVGINRAKNKKAYENGA
jgi:hypothetical protein